jgi:hypothetical protein
MNPLHGSIELLPHEVPALLDLIAGTVNSVLEVGTGDGVFVAMAAARFPSRVFHCVDGWVAAADSGTRPGNRDAWHRNLQHCPLVSLFEGNTNDVLPTLGREYGLVFIDANHSYASVLADADNAWRLLLPGGVLAFHDYGSLAEVRNAVKEFARMHARPVVPFAGTIVVIPSVAEWKPGRQYELHKGVYL